MKQTKLRMILFLYAVWSFMLLLPFSIHAQNVSNKRISVSEAQNLVVSWATTYSKSHGSNGESEHKRVFLEKGWLNEITPSESWEQLGVQVFQMPINREIALGVRAVLIKNGKVYPLGLDNTATDLSLMYTCDVDPTGRPTLVCTYVCGSGIQRSEVSLVYLPVASFMKSVKTKRLISVSHTTLILQRQDNHVVSIYASPFVQQGKPHYHFLLGRLTRSQSYPFINVVLRKSLPRMWRERIITP